MSFFFFSSRRRHTRSYGDWSSDVCSSDLNMDRLWPLTSSSAAITDPYYRRVVGRTRVRLNVREPWIQAVPGPLLGPRTQACPDRVEEDIVDRGREVFVAVDDPRRVAVAEQMAAALVSLVEEERVDPVQPMHPAGHRLDRRIEHEVVVG